MTDKEKAMMAKQMQPTATAPRISPDMIKNATSLTCNCGCIIFKSGVVIKKISAILSPSGDAMDVPIQVLYCKDCGLVHPDTDPEDVLPQNIKSSKLKIKTL